MRKWIQRCVLSHDGNRCKADGHFVVHMFSSMYNISVEILKLGLNVFKDRPQYITLEMVDIRRFN